MVSTTEIAEQFDELGLEPTGAILEQCLLLVSFGTRTKLSEKNFFAGVHLCNEYNITDPVEFVERWMAFSISHLNGADPTLDNLNDLERKEFANFKHANDAKNKSTSNKQQNNTSSYDDFPDDDIMGSYGFHTPKVNTFTYCYRCDR